jgi:hypothetical protein
MMDRDNRFTEYVFWKHVFWEFSNLIDSDIHLLQIQFCDFNIRNNKTQYTVICPVIEIRSV